MVFGCDDIYELLQEEEKEEDEIGQARRQAGNVVGYCYVDEEIYASADRVLYEATRIKQTIDALVEEYTAKLDYLRAIKTLVKKSIPLDFYA